MKNNPYTPTHGFINPNDMPVTGYGITLDTIKYFLIANDIDTKPAKLLTAFNESDLIDIDNTDIDNYLADHQASNLNYVTGTNTDFEGLISYDQSPISVLDGNVSVVTKEIIQQEIINTIYNWFELPNNVSDKALIYNKLRKFVNEYTDYISFNDFD